MFRILLILYLLFFTPALTKAQGTTAVQVAEAAQQSTVKLIIRSINIIGNKKTKSYIIEREIPFVPGDSLSIPELLEKFEIAKVQLTNTLLFHDSYLALDTVDYPYIDILVSVKERWYIFPIPYLQPVDRNFAEWYNQGLGFDRVKYGLKFTHNNFSGRNDKFKLWLITGYTKQFQIQYEQPYADPSLRHGFKIGFAYAHNTEVNFITIGNKQQFIDSTAFGKKRWNAHVDYMYRPGLRVYHNVRVSLNSEWIDDEVHALNPNYFGEGVTKVLFPELKYNFKYYGVDYIHYPLDGWLTEGNFTQRGWGGKLNMWQLDAKATYTRPLKKNFYFQWQGSILGRTPGSQPYYNQAMMGYGEFYLRGLDYYVIDGTAGFSSRQTIIKKLFDFKVNNILNIGTLDRIPFSFYARVYGDAGYGYSRVLNNNLLNNKLLYTTGVGLDIVTIYDFVFKLDFSVNQLGEKGLFLHIRNDF